jgi:hypothetical protein
VIGSPDERVARYPGTTVLGAPGVASLTRATVASLTRAISETSIPSAAARGAIVPVGAAHARLGQAIDHLHDETAA